MTRTSLIFTSSRTLADAAIRAWDGDQSSHVGIRVGTVVIDATFVHGVQRWALDAWLKGRTIVDELPVYATNEAAESIAVSNLVDRIGQPYDILEAIGFPLLRNLGDPNKPICSRLAIDYLTMATGLQIPGKQGRIAPRLVRVALHAYNLGRSSAPDSTRAL